MYCKKILLKILKPPPGQCNKYKAYEFQIKTEAANLDVLDSILDSISGCSEIGIKSQDIMRSLPGFKVKEGKSSLLLQQIERNNANSAMASPGSKCIEDEDKGIAEILMLQQRTVLQVPSYFAENFCQKSL